MRFLFIALGHAQSIVTVHRLKLAEPNFVPSTSKIGISPLILKLISWFKHHYFSHFTSFPMILSLLRFLQQIQKSPNSLLVDVDLPNFLHDSLSIPPIRTLYRSTVERYVLGRIGKENGREIIIFFYILWSSKQQESVIIYQRQSIWIVDH